jgi:hypothetical protein
MATGKKQHHGYRRVKCPSCGTLFRSPTTTKWREEPEFGYVEHSVTTHRDGVATIHNERVWTKTYPGLHEVKFTLCRQCSKGPSAPHSEQRST